MKIRVGKIFIWTLVVVLGLLFVNAIIAKKEYNLTMPQHRVVEIEKKAYSLTIQKYNPPFLFKKLLTNEKEMDRSKPEGVYIGILSAVDKDWYLSLFDKSVQEEFLKSDRESGDKVFKDMEKRTKSLQELNFKFIYKVNIEINGKEYAIIYGRIISKGKEYAPCTMTFVKEADGWKQTSSLRDPISGLVGRNSYEEFNKLTK